MKTERITYRCPSCGHQTIAIDNAGFLICTWIPCRNPAALHDWIQIALAAPEGTPQPEGSGDRQ